MRGFGGATLRGGQTVLHGLRMWGGQIVRAALGGKIAAVSVLAFLIRFRCRGRAFKRRCRVRGAELVSARGLRDRVLPLSERAQRVLAASEPWPWAIAGVPWSDRAETQHTIVFRRNQPGQTRRRTRHRRPRRTARTTRGCDRRANCCAQSDHGRRAERDWKQGGAK